MPVHLYRSAAAHPSACSVLKSMLVPTAPCIDRLPMCTQASAGTNTDSKSKSPTSDSTASDIQDAEGSQNFMHGARRHSADSNGELTHLDRYQCSLSQFRFFCDSIS